MDHLYIIIEYLFWIGLFLIFYTYLGYGILLYIMVRIKELFSKPAHPLLPDPLPDVTLFIAAYNEEDIVASKMDNCHALAYPKDKLKIVRVRMTGLMNFCSNIRMLPYFSSRNAKEKRQL